MTSHGNKSQFTIDDAFQETIEDKIRIYGTTSETAPLHPEEDLESPCDEVFITPTPERPILKNARPNLNNNSNLHHMQQIKPCRLPEDTTSQDSASLIQESGHGYYSGPAQQKFWWKHPKIRENWKMVLAAFLLVFIGSGLFVTGIVAYIEPSLAGIQGFVFFIAGIICVLPGAYHLGYIYLAVKGKRGFDFHHLPLFN